MALLVHSTRLKVYALAIQTLLLSKPQPVCCPHISSSKTRRHNMRVSCYHAGSQSPASLVVGNADRGAGTYSSTSLSMPPDSTDQHGLMQHLQRALTQQAQARCFISRHRLRWQVQFTRAIQLCTWRQHVCHHITGSANLGPTCLK